MKSMRKSEMNLSLNISRMMSVNCTNMLSKIKSLTNYLRLHSLGIDKTSKSKVSKNNMNLSSHTLQVQPMGRISTFNSNKDKKKKIERKSIEK